MKQKWLWHKEVGTKATLERTGCVLYPGDVTNPAGLEDVSPRHTSCLYGEEAVVCAFCKGFPKLSTILFIHVQAGDVLHTVLMQSMAVLAVSVAGLNVQALARG